MTTTLFEYVVPEGATEQECTAALTEALEHVRQRLAHSGRYGGLGTAMRLGIRATVPLSAVKESPVYKKAMMSAPCAAGGGAVVAQIKCPECGSTDLERLCLVDAADKGLHVGFLPDGEGNVHVSVDAEDCEVLWSDMAWPGADGAHCLRCDAEFSMLDAGVESTYCP